MNFFHPCTACEGTGIRKYNQPNGGPLVEENPCSFCNGEKVVLQQDHGIDDTLIKQILANQVTILAELDYIHGKVTAIWNAVKPGN